VNPSRFGRFQTILGGSTSGPCRSPRAGSGPGRDAYQVRQTELGIDIAVIAQDELNPTALTLALAQSLNAAGLADPQVRVREVTDIARHPETGKARRFLPL
jgi:hypothetical protein